MNGKRRIPSIRLLLFGQAVVFLIAAFVHAGLWIDGYRHREAQIAESVLAGALYVGLGLSWWHPLWTRNVGLLAQGFALVGTLIGMVTIAMGVGPQTIPDILYHLGMVGLLSWGLLYTVRTPIGLSEEAKRSWPRHAA
jgi:hypothetical protein